MLDLLDLRFAIVIHPYRRDGRVQRVEGNSGRWGRTANLKAVVEGQTLLERGTGGEKAGIKVGRDIGER